MKDSKGHGSDPRGAAHQAGVNDTGKWQTRLGFYSFGAGEVGKETASPIVQSHDSPQAAMLHLSNEINKGSAQTYHVVSPGGKPMAFNEAYRQTFKEEPKVTSGGRSIYPRLKGARVPR